MQIILILGGGEHIKEFNTLKFGERNVNSTKESFGIPKILMCYKARSQTSGTKSMIKSYEKRNVDR